MMNKNEKILVTRPVLPDFEVYSSYVKRIFDSRWLTNQGPLHQEFEGKLKELIGNNDITLFCNGHMALEAMLKSYNFEKGSEVITTPYTFISTINAIVNNGLKPVFCDIKLEDFTIDETKIEKLITDKTVAIMPVHVYGFPCNVDAIAKIAKKHNLKVFYDGAHAFGVTVNGKSIYNYGDATMASFHSTKLFHTIEGGMVVGNGDFLHDHLTIIKNFGINEKTTLVEESGFNAKMNEFACAMGLSLLPELNRIIETRKEKVELYYDLLKSNKGIDTFKPKEGVKWNYSYFPVIINDKSGITRDELFEALQEENIFSRKYFYPLCSDNDYTKVKEKDIKNARYASEHVLSLPLYPDLEDEQIKYICETINNKVKVLKK